jgi:GNAT superfamily N-acetyltransferase
MIRNYQSADLEECRALWKELADWHREIYEDATIGGEHPENHFDRHLALVGSNQIWVAEHYSQVLGFVGLILKGEEAEVEPLVVSTKYRGKRIGTLLIQRAVSEARARGVRLLNVKPVARNVKAVQFFHEHGFKNLGLIELFMDLSERSWKTGPRIFDRDFKV